MADHMELLRHATSLDAKLNGSKAEVYKPNHKTLFDNEADPFGGNHNNRKVAERVAKNGGASDALAAAGPVPDAKKAAKDVAKAKAAGNKDGPKPDKDEPLTWRPNA